MSSSMITDESENFKAFPCPDDLITSIKQSMITIFFFNSKLSWNKPADLKSNDKVFLGGGGLLNNQTIPKSILIYHVCQRAHLKSFQNIPICIFFK